MTFNYYPDTDSLYIDLLDRPSVETLEVRPGIALDFGEDGRLVGIDIEHASEHVNLERLEVQRLPVASVALSA